MAIPVVNLSSPERLRRFQGRLADLLPESSHGVSSIGFWLRCFIYLEGFK